MSYNPHMNTQVEESPIVLHIRRMGETYQFPMESVSEAIDQAIEYIDSGYAVAKSITRDGEELYSEADINTYWAERRCEG